MNKDLYTVLDHGQMYAQPNIICCMQVVRVAGVVEGVPRLRGVFERADAEETSSGDHDDLQDVTDHTLGGSSIGSGPSRTLARQAGVLTPR